jgi:alkylhydroperoxidase/carboxymuconolactone decarboxylase family protein YurZ
METCSTCDFFVLTETVRTLELVPTADEALANAVKNFRREHISLVQHYVMHTLAVCLRTIALVSTTRGIASFPIDPLILDLHEKTVRLNGMGVLISARCPNRSTIHVMMRGPQNITAHAKKRPKIRVS